MNEPHNTQIADIKLPKLPWAALISGSLLALMMTGFVALASFSFTKKQADIYNLNLSSAQTIANIRYYDELLTMTARIFAATGNSKWEKRYNDVLPKFFAEIDQAKIIAPKADSDIFAATTGVASEKLATLETEAFSLSKAGKSTEALALLLGKTYETQQQANAAGIHTYFGAMNRKVAIENAKVSKLSQQIIYVTCTALLLFLVICIYFYAKLSSWHRGAIKLLDTYKSDVASAAARDLLAFEAQKALADSKQEELLRADRIASAAIIFESAVKSKMLDINTDSSRQVELSNELRAEATSSSDKMIRRMSETKAAVESMAAATEELTASIAEINGLVMESKSIAEGATGEVGNANSKMASLTEAAGRISDISKLITEITSRTNLLALNATIEAARAGESGRGFAVVANEVKSLARQTAGATDEIDALIIELQNAATESIQAVVAISTTIADIDIRVSTIAAAVQQQNNAAIDMASNAQSAHGYVDDFERFFVTTNTTVANANDFADSQSENLSNLGNKLGAIVEDVNRFLDQLRAA
jgi:methyl-accepting chemotaxis protein